MTAQQTTTPSDITSKSVGADGGDVWNGLRVTRPELVQIASEATSTAVQQPVMAQFYARRGWLWKQWGSTVGKAVLPREVLFNALIALLISAFFFCPGPYFAWRSSKLVWLKGVNQVWLMTSSLVTFTISFFLTQAYSVWRTVYTLSRRVQGRLNDLGLLCASCAARDASGAYTESSAALLETVGRYARLFSALLYASASSRFAPLRTPQGLAMLVEFGELTEEERANILASAAGGHNVVITWLWAVVSNGVRDGRLVGMSASGGTLALETTLERTLLELRGTYASIGDELSGRMPLAYTQLVQILVDMLVVVAPFALLPAVGPFNTVVGSAVITFFYSAVLLLAKVFLDPYDNESCTSRFGISINVATLVQETNLGSKRWGKAAFELPSAARPLAATAAAVAAEQPSEDGEQPAGEQPASEGQEPVKGVVYSSGRQRDNPSVESLP